jgi:hypothetical protein
MKSLNQVYNCSGYPSDQLYVTTTAESVIFRTIGGVSVFLSEDDVLALISHLGQAYNHIYSGEVTAVVRREVEVTKTKTEERQLV